MAVLAAFVGCALLPTAGARKSYLANTVEASTHYPGKLRASEVPMRGLLPRANNNVEPHDTLEAIQAFHATRLEWIYELNPVFMREARALGVTVSGAVNPTIDIGINRASIGEARRYSVLDRHGGIVTPPWMTLWNPVPLWLCINNPEAREKISRYLEEQVQLGISDIQYDGAGANVDTIPWGGCFCQYCLAGFREYLGQYVSAGEWNTWRLGAKADFDYSGFLNAKEQQARSDIGKIEDALENHFKNFQLIATKDYNVWSRSELDKFAGRRIPVSANNGAAVYGEESLYLAFDFWIGELPAENASPEYLHLLARAVRRAGKGQTVTMPLPGSMPMEASAWIALTRKTLATAYATGMWMEAPWDTYLPEPKAPRHFGWASNYADLYALVRACAYYLDGYEEVAVAGQLISKMPINAGEAIITLSPVGTQIAAFARVKPGETLAPVVVHLVNWGDNEEPVKLRIRGDSLFAGRKFQAELFVPELYNEGRHRRAFESGVYSALVERRMLHVGDDGAFVIPPLSPWGLMVLTPLR